MPKHDYQEVDYAIVGAGVIGVCCALLLARNTEKKVALIGNIHLPEQNQRTYALNRVSQQLLMQAGIWQLLDPVPYNGMYVHDIETATHLTYKAEDQQEANLGHMVTDRDLALAMKSLVDSSSIITHPVKLKSLNKQDSKSKLLLEDGAQLTSKLVLAADGKASKVASLCNIPVKHVDTGDSSIVGNLLLERDHQYRAHQWFSNEGIIAFLPLKGKKEASLVWSVNTRLANHLMQKTQNELNRYITHASLQHLGNIRITSPLLSFPISQHNLQSYYIDGVVFVGDSAHSIHPLAGQGMNIGMQDVLELMLQLIKHENKLSSEASALFRFQQNRQLENHKILILMKSLQKIFRSKKPIIKIGRSLASKAFQNNALLQKHAIRTALYGGVNKLALDKAIHKIQARA